MGKNQNTSADQIHQWPPCRGDADDPLEVRIIRGDDARTILWCPAGELADHADELLKHNRDGWNIYASVNARNGQARGDKAVLHARCVFADHDHATVEQARVRRDAVGMPPPTMSVWSGHGVHDYWLIEEAIAPVCWREWQRDLAALLGSDPLVHNPERVMRLPGFENHKPPAATCELIEADPTRIYDLASLPIPMRPGSDTPVPVFTMHRTVKPADTGDPVARCRDYLARCPRAVAGAGGHKATWYAANTCLRFGLTETQALAAMQWFNETHADPKWSDREIGHKVRDAYQRNAGQRGQKLREDRNRKPVFTMRKGAAA